MAGCSDDGDTASDGESDASTRTTAGLPEPKDAPFDTVVVLMMENRSFDHLLGWMPGVEGQQEGLTYKDKNGVEQATWPLAPDWQGCEMQDPFHFWQAMADQYNDGACDGFLTLQPEGDLFPIGYYTREDMPILAALAENYTLYDHYFSSMLGPTWPNYIYQLCATTDIDYTGSYPAPGEPRPVELELAIFDRLSEAGLSSAYYYFGEPITGLFASQRYDSISHNIDRFFSDAEAGTLPNFSLVSPDYTTQAELDGTSNDMHPYGSVQVAQEFMAKVHDAVARSPQWERTVFVMNFDESGGFFEHVPPPAVEDDTVLPGEGPFPNLKMLGFRVPAIAMGPFAPKQIVTDGPFEHCSILKMVEWRWGLEPMTVRDRNARNLAETLDFTTKRGPLELPEFTAEPARACDNPDHVG
jgi:phospholipase C